MSTTNLSTYASAHLMKPIIESAEGQTRQLLQTLIPSPTAHTNIFTTESHLVKVSDTISD